MKMPATLAALLAVPMLLTACTTQEAYRTAQGWQKQQCLKLQDLDERRRCEQSTAVSYERYREEAEAARRPSSPP